MSDAQSGPGRLTTRARIRRYIGTMLERARRVEPPAIASIKKYLVLSTPRTGSTMLCRILENNAMGWPIEWFNELYMFEAQSASGAGSLDIQAYARNVILGTYSPETNVFGVNVHVRHYLLLKQRGFDVFDLGFDRVYYVYRRDKAKQAYSQAKSTKTGLWSREAEREAGLYEASHVDVTPREFCDALTAIVSACEYADVALRARFDRSFCFEELLAGGVGSAIQSIAKDLGRPNEPIDARIPSEPQASARDSEDLARILRGLGIAP